MFRQFMKRQQTRLGSQLKANLIAIGILFSLFMLGCHNYVDSHFKETYGKVDKLNTLGGNVDALKESMIDQETGQRGYLFTGDVAFLEPYVVGTRNFEAKSQALQSALEDFPDLKEPIRQMIERGTLWHKTYGEPMVQGKRTGNELKSDEYMLGKEAFDSFREASREASQRIEDEKANIGSRLEQDVDNIWNMIIAFSLPAGLLALISVNQKFRQIVRPIVELERGVREYANRNFDVPVPKVDHDNELASLIQGVNLMRQELKERFQQTQRLAEIDVLTGVANRRLYDVMLAELVQQAQQGGRAFALVLLDIDHFKLFNDNFGHLAGDSVLRHVAGVLSCHLLPGETLARYGGEEFAVLVPYQNREDCLKRVEHLRTAIETEPLVPYHITASFGVAFYRAGDTAVTLFEKADQALYRAKANGRNRAETA